MPPLVCLWTLEWSSRSTPHSAPRKLQLGTRRSTSQSKIVEHLSTRKRRCNNCCGPIVPPPFRGIVRQVSQGTIDGWLLIQYNVSLFLSCFDSLSPVGVVVWYLGRPRRRIIVVSRNGIDYTFPTPSGSKSGSPYSVSHGRSTLARLSAAPLCRRDN
jgi:hypothetical protein